MADQKVLNQELSNEPISNSEENFKEKFEQLKQEIIDIYFMIPGYKQLYSMCHWKKAELLSDIDAKLKQCLDELDITVNKGRDYDGQVVSSEDD